MGTEPEPTLKEIANKAADALGADILVVNSKLVANGLPFIAEFQAPRRKNGHNGSRDRRRQSDAAFRMMRSLQNKYERIIIAVTGWCEKRGHFDVRRRTRTRFGGLWRTRPDRCPNREGRGGGWTSKSPALSSKCFAFEKLQQEASKLFMSFLSEFENTHHRITLKTAMEIARVLKPALWLQFSRNSNLITIGEDYRSNRLALAYGERLNVKAKNLQRRCRIWTL